MLKLALATRNAAMSRLPDPATEAPVVPRDVFVYFITEGKVRAPFGAMALMKRVAG